MAKLGYLPKEKLTALLEALSKEQRLFVPCQAGDAVLFQQYDATKTPCLDRPATTPPKGIIFPQDDTLFTFTYHKDAEDLKKVSVELKENLDVAPTIIFGARPCDAKGFLIYDRPYTETDTPDPYYKKRRDMTAIMTLACPAPSPGCFCTSVGGDPADKDGSDVLITQLESGYLFESITEKGEAILQNSLFEEGSSYQEQAQRTHEAVAELVRKPFQVTEELTQKVLSLFENDSFWEEEANKCISCGACTYLCPTCYCFNITDEQAGSSGERIRTWDACMFYHFTLEASGHNPRALKHQRLKNRVGHKFSYYPQKYDGAIACCGCGRCVRYCPVSVDISEIVAHAQEYTNDHGE